MTHAHYRYHHKRRSSTGSVIQIATATVNGASVTILTNAQGLTLYYRDTDVPPSTVCSGGCANAWPPLVISSSSIPTSAVSLPGKLTIVEDANGKQIEYNAKRPYKDSKLERLCRKYPAIPKSCQSCGESRVVEIAHRPEFRHVGGVIGSNIENRAPHMIWVLCPTCHKLLDKGICTPSELGLA